MLKKTITLIVENRKTIIRRAVILGGSVVGLIIADAVLNKTATPDVIVIETETPEGTDFTEDQPDQQ